ncbi:MAG TPA: AAA family ATPase [Solirubrobacteraceae bacterium]|nr:AAA family ATPase [Solirubrobacteraceae bacterium]
MLRVRVLGELALELDGTPLEPPASRRARSLLGLLAVDRRTHSRSQLAASFWPDVLDESARTSLRSALSSLRKAVGSDIDRYLISGRESVALAGGELVWVDLSEFEALLAAGRLEEALVLCRGELLAGLDDEWIHERRDEHHDRMAEAFAQLAADAEERGDLGEAVALTRRQVALDPLAEQPQRELIRRLGAAGDRPAALTAYRRLQDRLRSELGIAPSARTRELVESLRDSPEPESPAPAPRDSQPPPDEAPAARSAPRRPAGTVTLLFTDQVSSTETLERLGDDEAEFLRRTHFALLRDVASAHGGLEVKNLGDGLMVAFASAVDAVAAAIGIQQAVHRHAERERDSRLGVRVGLNVGEPIVDEDDYFGTPVVVAKRLCDAADSGQILAADIVRALVGTRGGFEFRPLPPVPLKGIADPVASCEIGWTPTAEQRIPLPPTVVGTEIGAFVGREDARARLDGHWREVLEGQRRVVLLAGDPGIGKTRLAAEFSRAAHEDGAAVLAGRCYEEMLLPHQPFVEALRHYVAGCPPAELTVQVATRRRELAALVPELDAPGTAAEPRGEAEQERFRMFEAVASLLSEIALTRPTILVLDDLHWADEASLLLLRHVVRASENSRLLVLGTYRKTELDPRGDLAVTLADLRRARALHEVELGGLLEREVAELIRTQSGEAAPEPFTRQVAERTAGNPFFIEELLRHVESPSGPELAELSLPDSVKDLLLRRLARLGDESRRALGVAAVAGREFELSVLERVLDVGPEQLVDLLDGAVQGQVLAEEAGAFGRYHFAHPLIRETIYGDISVTRRALLHRRLGEALESLYEDHLAEHAGALAHHYHAAGDAEKAFEYHRQAADQAERGMAPETAFEHLTGAIAAGELLGLTARTDATMRDLYRRRAWMATFAGTAEIAERDYEVALEAARSAGDRGLEMQVLNGLGTLLHVLDSKAAIGYHEQALAIAEQLGDEAGQVSALNRLSLVHANRLDYKRALELGERALALARGSEDDEAAMRAMDSLKFVAVQLGDIGRLEQLTSHLERHQRAHQDIWFLQWTLFERSCVPIAHGSWDEAAAMLDEAVALGDRMGDTGALSLTLHGRCSAERLRGDYGRSLEAGRAAMAKAEQTGGSWLGWTAMALALALRDLYEVDEARETLELGFGEAERLDARAQILSCVSDLAWVRWLSGDEPGARELLGRVERLLDEVLAPVDQAYLYTIATYTSAARVALAAAEPDRAESMLRRYLGPAARSGIRHALAEGHFLLARCAETRGETAEAERLLGTALKDAGTDGLLSFRREIHGELARLTAIDGRVDEAGEHARAARDLIEQIAASVGDEGLRERFRAAALVELDTSAPAPS